jgi:hypothetical protein
LVLSCAVLCCAVLQTLILLAALLVLPTVWLRDLSLLSFLSVGGIFASVALLALVGWEGASVTGFTHQHPPFVSWSGVPISAGLFMFCFSGKRYGQRPPLDILERILFLWSYKLDGHECADIVAEWCKPHTAVKSKCFW